MGQDGAIAEKVKRVLEGEFPLPDRVRVNDGDGVLAFVVSGRFRGVEDLARQDLVWRPLNQALAATEKRRVALVVPVTPEEDDDEPQIVEH